MLKGFCLPDASTKESRFAYQRAWGQCQLTAASMLVLGFQENLPKPNPIEQKHERIIDPNRGNIKN